MMRAVAITALLAVGAAYGAVVSVGGFYGASVPAGGEGFEDAEAGTSTLGFGGKFSVGGMSGLNFDYGFGYHTKYELESFMEYEFHYSAIPITSGVSYKFDAGAVKPYVGLGGAYVIMGFHADAPWIESDKDRFCFPGAYVGGGIIYSFTDTIALDVNPRYMVALDPDDGGIDFGFFDILVGADFYI
jgi:hypothetical protein